MFEGVGMTDETLVKLSFQAGRYEGELRAAEETSIEAVHDGRVIAAGRLVHGEGASRVSVEFPSRCCRTGCRW
jgi:hypothetical protein